MREAALENKLRNAVKTRGGIALKFVSPGFAGVPDRLILLPGGRTAFIEVKVLGEKPRPNQLLRHKQLTALGCKVYILDHPNKIKDILNEIQAT